MNQKQKIRSKSGTLENWNRIMIRLLRLLVPEKKKVRKWIPVEAQTKLKNREKSQKDEKS